MSRKEILEQIKELSKSQGFYGRLLRYYEDMQVNNPEDYEDVMKELESQNFNDVIEMIMYFEQ